MKLIRRIAWGMLVLLTLLTLPAEWITAHSYETQFREDVDREAGSAHLLGTDALGRDRFSRLVFGTRLSLLLAPSAAALSVLIAALVGGVAGFTGGSIERAALTLIDLFLSLPWLFMLLAARAALPLNAAPAFSVLLTFGLLAGLGWAGAARAVCTAARQLRRSELMLQARAMGLSYGRLIVVQLIPNLRPILFAQFIVTIPTFILAEANLGVLGLSVSEPLPSLGNLLAELQDFPKVLDNPIMLAPAVLLVSALCSLQIVSSKEVNS